VFLFLKTEIPLPVVIFLSMLAGGFSMLYYKTMEMAAVQSEYLNGF
jgi:uncharacterized integral membrane protein